MTATPTRARSVGGAYLTAPKAKPKATARPKHHPHTTPMPTACHCSPNPHHPCPHTPRSKVQKAAAASKAQATKIAKAAAMTPGQKKAAVAKRHTAAVKAAATRAAHKKAARAANPHNPAAKKPAKKAC